MQLRREPIGMVLRVVIDGPDTGGAETVEDSVGIDECQRVSQDLSALLDVEDEFGQTSLGRLHAGGVVAGLDRPLRHEADYRRFAGRLAKIVTTEPIERPDARSRDGLRGVEDGARAAWKKDAKTHRVPLDADQAGEPGRGVLGTGANDMQNPLLQQIDAIAKEKGVEPEIIIGAVQDALEAAARKKYKGEELKARFNPETGDFELFTVKKIVAEVTDPATSSRSSEAQQMYGEEAEVDMEVEFPGTEELGRIAAQTAKQVIFQKVREAERENVYAEYSNRVGEVVSGVVKRFENGDIIMELGRIEAQLPRKEQSRAENYAVGDRVRAVIRGVNRSAKGPQIVLSRTDPALLIKLFEQEVPEIYDGTVMIRGAVREAGDRAKVAVYSRERDVDPVGACVGMKGTRVQSIIRELRGEKIDIVEWSEDSVAFVTNAISPAKVQRVSIVDDERARDGSRRRGQAAVARDRQEGPERPPGRQADRLEDRHQERGREAPRGRGAVRRARDRRHGQYGYGGSHG